jgi:dipeptide/tripeptide permease
MLKTFLYALVERTMQLTLSTPTYGYLLVSLFLGVHDTAPIFVSILSDASLGSYRSIVLFGGMLVIGLTVISWLGGSWTTAPLGGRFAILLALLGLVAVSAGSLVTLLTSFGASQFHPTEQARQGSSFFTMVFACSNLGAIIGIGVAVMIHFQFAYGFTLVAAALAATTGWITFLFGSRMYVRRCVHSSTVIRALRLSWDCLRKRSFSKNKKSNGGEYDDMLVDDMVILTRLIPVFAAVSPLYTGQLQIYTTFRSMAYQLSSSGTSFVPEVFLLIEPTSAIICCFVFDYWLWPYLRSHRSLPTHLTRLSIAAMTISCGFIAALIVQYAVGQDSANGVAAYLSPALFLFAVGQYMITSSGYELSWSHAPDSMKSLSVSLFLMIYAMGSVFGTMEFLAMGAFFDEKPADMGKPNEGFRSRFDVYFLINIGLCGLSLLALILLRGFYDRTREMRIDREIERKAVEIAMERIRLRTTVTNSQ